jgi:hypothetical protein
MLSGLKVIVDLLATGVRAFKEVRKENSRQNSALSLLTAYFLFRALVSEGRELLKMAGPDPVAKVSTLPASERREHVRACHRALRRQQFRLHKLSEIIFGEALLDVIDPALRNKIEEAIGNKFEGSVLSAAAAIEIYLMFGALPTAEDIKTHGEELAGYRYQGHLAATFFGPNSDLIDINRAQLELDSLDHASIKLLDAIKTVFDLSTLTRLANEAELKAAAIENPQHTKSLE